MWLTDWVKECFRKADMVLLALIVAASLFGVVLIYSATRYLGQAGIRYVPIQLISIVLGVVAYFIMSFVDVELFTEKSWKWMFGFNVFIILLLLTPFGVGGETTGNNSWLAFPFLPVNIQPAEVAKVFFVLLLALQCRKLQDWGISRFTSVIQLAGHTLFMAGLIAVISGDFGMSLVYLGLFVIMAWTAGVKKRWFLLGLAGCAGGMALVWSHLPSYIQERFTVVIDHITGNPETLYQQTQDRGWQQTRSVLAIGSGGVFGQGYLQGTQTQSTSEGTLPARYNDEIFAVCGEEEHHRHHSALHLGGPAGQQPHVGLYRHGLRRHAPPPDRHQYRHVPLRLPGGGPHPPVLQLRRLLHHHPLRLHGYRLRHQDALPAQLAPGPQSAGVRKRAFLPTGLE